MVEYRAIELSPDENLSENRIISGLAIPVESRSALLGGKFYETISRDAINEALITNNDIRLLYNHESGHGTLGRSKFGEGTLRLKIEDDGLHFECELPDTEFGRSISSGLKRGEIDAVSFGFCVGDESWEDNADGTYNRRVNKIDKLVEISCLDMLPAYDATEVNLRSLEQHIEDKKKLNDEILEKLSELKKSINESIDAILNEDKEETSEEVSQEELDDEKDLIKQ